MITKKNQATLTLILAALALLATYSCKKMDGTAPKKLSLAPAARLDTVNYSWGDMSINRGTESEVVRYQSDGKIDSILILSNGGMVNSITFTYQGNTITLNTPTHDTYQLDAQGRVIKHTASQYEAAGNFTYVNTEAYQYDSNGYISLVTMAGNDVPYSYIKYKVQNGNYTSYTLTNADNTATVTRAYTFTYNTTQLNTAFQFFSPIFGNNTGTCIEKYLNFGSQSLNLLSQVNYTIADEGGATQTGSLSVQTEFDASGKLTKFSLDGPVIPGFPLDNLSPLPRSVSFTYNK